MRGWVVARGGAITIGGLGRMDCEREPKYTFYLYSTFINRNNIILPHDCALIA